MQLRCTALPGKKAVNTMTYKAGRPALVRAGSTGAQTQPQPQHHLPMHTKTIYLIRHGEGFHNIGYADNLDAHLTPRGWAQTAALQQHLQALQSKLDIELVVVSPLRRTLETAAGVFGARAPPTITAAAAATGTATGTAAAAAAAAATAAAAAAHHPWVFMRQQLERPYEVTPQPILYLPPVLRRTAAAAAAAAAAGGAVFDAARQLENIGISNSSGNSGSGQGEGISSSYNSGSSDNRGAGSDDHEPLRLLAHEGCRERIGPNVCDRFRDMSLQVPDFPGIDFSLMQHSSDTDWENLHHDQCCDGGCYLVGEEASRCEQRALDFYAWLMDRPESVIAVVSHCGFLVHGMRALGKSMFMAWGDCMMLQLSAQDTSAGHSASKAAGNSTTAAGGDSTTAADNSATGGLALPQGLSANGYIPAGPSAVPVVPSGSGRGFDSQDSHQAVVFSGNQGTGTKAAAAAATAEAVRHSAADLTGWMSADWNNCECRSIVLSWVDTSELLSVPTAAAVTPPAAAGAAAGQAAAGGPAAAAGASPGSGVVTTVDDSSAPDAACGPGRRFLWARPGESTTWFPGGMFGITQL